MVANKTETEFIKENNCPDCNYSGGGADVDHCQIYKTTEAIKYWAKYEQCRNYNTAEWS